MGFNTYKTSLVVQWLRFRTANAGGLGLIPGQGTRSHMVQLRICMLQLKILHAATKTWCSQIGKGKSLSHVRLSLCDRPGSYVHGIQLLHWQADFSPRSHLGSQNIDRNTTFCVRAHAQSTPWTVALWASLSMEFSRQEYWSELPFPTPSDLSSPGIEPASLLYPALAGRFFYHWATWESLLGYT